MKILAIYAERRFVVRIEPTRPNRQSRERPDLLVMLPVGALATDVTVFVGSVTGPIHLDAAARAKQQTWQHLSQQGKTFMSFAIVHTRALH